MKIAILWTKLSGYLNACLQELNKMPGTQLFVCNEKATADAPFSDSQFSWISNRYEYTGTPEISDLLARLEAFKPDVILGAAYHVPAYRRICKRMRGRSLRIYCTDNPWSGSIKQLCGSLISRQYLLSLYDAIFVPGERQATWARNVGFSQTQIWYGSFSCDHEIFSAANAKRCTAPAPPESFIYAGRLIAVKGVATLAEGYRIYRSKEPNPWPLIVIGNGPLSSSFDNLDGVTRLNFIQPAQLPKTLADAGCLVLCGYDHWGIIIHEAASAGLPIICSSACGASVHLVQEGYNGFLIDPKCPESTAAAMIRFTRLSPERRCQMGVASSLLAKQFTPKRWAQCVIEQASEILQQNQPPQLALAVAR